MPETDLSALNDGERTALVLLAQGHTAKSIAQLTGRSVTSVNERLREARRKTGVGSSRELARLLAAQENRDKQIGVATPDLASAPIASEAARHARGRIAKGPIVMAVLILGGAAAALLLQPSPLTKGTPQQQAVGDPETDAMIRESGPSPREQYDLLRSEKQDASWAPGAEDRLRTRYLAVAGIGGSANPLRVTCGTTICEVTGSFVPGSHDSIDRVSMQIQSAAFDQDLAKLGFKPGTTSFYALRFIGYWRRADR